MKPVKNHNIPYHSLFTQKFTTKLVKIVDIKPQNPKTPQNRI